MSDELADLARQAVSKQAMHQASVLARVSRLLHDSWYSDDPVHPEPTDTALLKAIDKAVQGYHPPDVCPLCERTNCIIWGRL